MVGVFANFLEVIVLTTYSQTFLAVGYSAIRRRHQSQEYILELIHPGVGEEQGLVANGDYRRTGDKLVVLTFEKVYKAVSYFFCSKHSGKNQISKIKYQNYGVHF
jgi:hypothetical protein